MAGVPMGFDILVLFGIKVVNFLCSGREGFQLYTRVCLASSSGLWLFGGMTSKCQVWRLLHMEQGGSPGRVMLLVVSILFLEFCFFYLLSEVISVLFLFLY